MISSWQRDDDANRAYFDERVKQWNLDVRGADWGGRQSQYLRFGVLAEVAPLNGARILDVGCGTGEFLEYLRGCGLSVDYTGIDIAPAAVAVARERFADATFVEGSVLDLERHFEQPFDHVFTSGIFTRRLHDGRGFVETTVTSMFALCRRSVSFNCLSAWADRIEGDEFHLDPADAIAVGRKLTKRLILRHDYHPADLTVHLYRQPQS
jgi:SAM-dependent methyltransferase